MITRPMADAAYAVNIPPGFDVVAGYLGGPDAFHAWPAEDWARFPGAKVPIWVGAQDGPGEAAHALTQLRRLGVPPGAIMALDMETRTGRLYVVNFAKVIQAAGYRLWVYGSLSTVFNNPPVNGYWVADYGISLHQAISVLSIGHVRAVQDRNDLTPGYDAGLVKEWAEGEMWGG